MFSIQRRCDPFQGLLELFEENGGPLVSSFAPRVDVAENDREFRVEAELPGLDEKDVDVSLDRDVLTIRGEKKSEREEKGKQFYRMERSFGAFSRMIAVPAEVDQARIEASFKKGVLTVVLPKTATAQPQSKKITVKSE